MGCWNGTCGISNLPILDGEDVLFHIIINNTNNRRQANTYHYHNDPFIPLSFPMIGKYNEYGSVCNIEYNITTSLIARYFNLDFDKLLPKIGEGNIKIVDDLYKNTLMPTGIWMCRKDIVDDFFKSDYEIALYSTKYRVYDVPLNIAFEDSAREYYQRLCKSKNCDGSLSKYINKPHRSTEAPLDVAICGSFSAHKTIGPIFDQQLEWLIFLIKNDYDFESEEVQAFFECVKNYLKIDIILQDTRRGYQPQFGLGSQSLNVDAYKRLHQSFSKSLANMLNKTKD